MNEQQHQGRSAVARGWIAAAIVVGVLVLASLVCVLAFAQSASRSTASASPGATPPAPPPPAPPAPVATSADGTASADMSGDDTAEPGEVDNSAAEGREGEGGGVPMTEFAKKDFTVAARHTAEGDRYFVGKDSDVEGTINGDFFTFGKGTSIPGHVTGDLNSLCSNVSVTGSVDDDVRVLSGDLIVRGRIGGDLMALSGEVNVAKGAHVAGRTLVFAPHASFDGDFGQQMDLVGGEINFGGHAHGDVKVESDALSFTDDARIDGNLTYTARQELEALQGDQARRLVGGKVTFVPKKPEEEKKSSGFARIVSMIWSFVASFLIGCGLILIAKRLVRTILVTARVEMLKSFGFGMIGHILVPFVGLVFLCFCFFLGFLTYLTTGGRVPPLPFAFLPIGLMVLAIWAVLFYLSKFVVSAALGDTLLRRMGREPSPYLSLLVGMIPVWILLNLPYGFGFVLYLIVVPVLGIGAILVGLRAHFTRRETAFPSPLAPSNVL